MCKFFFTFALMWTFAVPASAQSTADDIAHVVERLFDGMRAGDSTVVRSVLHPEARLVTTGTRDGKPDLHVASIDRFVEAVDTPHQETWDERIWNLDVRTDDRLATAWMDYAFFIGERLSHCGVNAFQFFHGEDGWKIIQISDTRRTEGCELPDDL